MNIVGLLVEIKQDYSSKEYKLNIEKEVVTIEKETQKLLKIKRSGSIFGYLNNIPKDDLEKVKSKDYNTQLERKIWFIEDEYSEEQAINVLKLSLSAELRRRQEFIDAAVKLVR